MTPTVARPPTINVTQDCGGMVPKLKPGQLPGGTGSPCRAATANQSVTVDNIAPVTHRAYVHDAVVQLHRGGSPNAPGGAITKALCGSWNHRPPCPLAPHHTAHHVSGDEVTLRVLFAADTADEPRVRQLIDDALAAGELTGPDGLVTRWRLKSAAAGLVRPDEHDHVTELIAHH